MVCRECQQPLRVISGGNRIVEDKIIHVAVFGCMNDKCSMCMQEQTRTETEQEQFTE